MTWKALIPAFGGPFVLSNSITLGLIATGLMGYSNSVARDRDKGIFQRLRVAPVPSGAIMISRLIVQLVMIMMIATLVFIVGHNYDKITLTPSGYALTYLAAFVGGAVYLSLGQMIVGLIKNPETVNSTTRLVYFVFIMVGMFGELDADAMGKAIHNVEHWSPYGTVKTIVAASMEPTKWDSNTSTALLLTLVYAIVFAVFGIKWFKWNTK
jgi:ABC-2 type transport system permease protein